MKIIIIPKNAIYCSRIEVSKGIGVSKTTLSKECIICHYWYYLDEGFRFQLGVCRGSHDLLMVNLNLKSNAILIVHCVDYCCIIAIITKSETINVWRNADMNEKSGSLWNIDITFIIYKK